MGGGGGKKGFKRFYDKVTVHAPACGGDNGGADTFWQVHLDGRVLKSPAKAPLRLPTEAIATGVALEWDSMGEMIEPHLTMRAKGDILLHNDCLLHSVN